MKAEKIREIDSKDLATRLKDADEQIFRLKFQMAMGQMEGMKKYRELKKDRARMLTVLGDRARNEQKGTK
ncbi:MAG: 50S ribosomal protein L29 [Bryobacteraceae bacterium]|jgi:large subunit ribosomal protein L29